MPLSILFLLTQKFFHIASDLSVIFLFFVQLTSQRKTQELSQIYMNNFFFYVIPLRRIFYTSTFDFIRIHKKNIRERKKPLHLIIRNRDSHQASEPRRGKKINFCIRKVIDKLLQWSKKFGNYFLISVGIRKIFCYVQHNFKSQLKMKFLLLFFLLQFIRFYHFIS